MNPEISGEEVQKVAVLHDFKTYLEYVKNNPIKVTRVNKYIPLRDIRKINSLFKSPQPLQIKVGNTIFKLRNEGSFPYLFFLDILAYHGELVGLSRDGWLFLTFKGEEFLTLSPPEQLERMFLSWWWEMEWGVIYPYAEEIVEELQEKQWYVGFSLLKIRKEEVGVERFCGNLRRILREKRGGKLLKRSVENAVLDPLRLFGGIKPIYRPGSWGEEMDKFRLTLLGEKLLLKALFPPHYSN